MRPACAEGGVSFLSSTITIFLVDDHAVVRSGVRALLASKRPSIKIVGEAESGEDALRLVPGLSPTVVLLDLSLPGMSGLDTARVLRERAPHTRLVALSMFEDVEHVRGFLEAGGSGYVPKGGLEAQLLDAIAAVVRGEYFMPPRILAGLAREIANPDPYRNVKLTKREQETVQRVARGETYREIAAALGISEKTVATYRERAAGKLGLKSRAELVRWALQHDLVS